MTGEKASTEVIAAPPTGRFELESVRGIAFAVALLGSVWFWAQAVSNVLGFSFLTSLTPSLAPVMVSGIVFFSLGFIGAVLLLIFAVRKKLPVAYSTLYWVTSVVTWAFVYYGSMSIGEWFFGA